jgi:DedD protein
MDQNIKNRLVGIIVVFALAVIFLPMVLDGSGVNKDKLEVVIPAQPSVAENPEFEHKLIELKEKVDALPDLDARLIDENSPENKTERPIVAKKETDSTSNSSSGTQAQSVTEAKEPVKVKPAIKSDIKAQAKSGGDSWVLQVGSFQDRKKALIQRDKIRKSNLAAVFIEQFDIDNKSNYRVRLGPFLNRDQTRVAQNKIKAKHDIDGIIMKYER